MLELTRLPAAPGTTTRTAGRCRAGQLCEASKQATEAALDAAHARAQASRRADVIPALLLVLLVLAALTH